MTTAAVVIEDGSLAIRGAVETLRDSDSSVLLSVYQDVGSLPPPAQPTVLLADPFAGSQVGLADLTCLAKSYLTLVMSACIHIDSVRYALQLGVRGFISKDTSSTALLDAIRAVSYGGIYLPSPLDGMLFDHPGDDASRLPLAQADSLTPRERAVLVMVAQGLTHKQVGTKLSLSKATVDTYVQRIRQKIGSGNKADLTRLAIDLGLVDDGAVTGFGIPHAQCREMAIRSCLDATSVVQASEVADLTFLSGVQLSAPIPFGPVCAMACRPTRIDLPPGSAAGSMGL
jgi:two-component system, NarL family, nitrate/nitrite response regulator NarL